DEAVWLDEGVVRAHGDPRRVVDAYLTAVEKTEEQQMAATTARAVESAAPPSTRPADMFQATEGRWGSREVEIADVVLVDGRGEPSFVFHSGEPMSIRLKVRAVQPTDDFVFGIGLF